MAELSTDRPLRLAQLHGPELARLGATAEVTHGPDYATARRWSHALWSHPDGPDGILYHSRHDDDELCLVLFDRAAASVALRGTAPLASNRALPELLARYRLALIRP